MIKSIGCILLCMLLLFAGGCGSGGNLPDASSTASALAADTMQPGDTTATDTALPDDSASPAPTDTVAPDDTSSAGATDTVQPDDTATPAPTDTLAPDDTSATPDTASPTDTSSAPKTLSVKKVTGKANVTDYLPLRSSASSTASILVKIPKDGSFTITKVMTDTAWLKVTYSGKTGYVLAKYVTVGSGSGDKVCTVSTSSTLNVRDGAGKKYKIIGVLKANATLIVTDVVTVSSDKWCKVTIGKSTGYINAAYCRLSSN